MKINVRTHFVRTARLRSSKN